MDREAIGRDIINLRERKDCGGRSNVTDALLIFGVDSAGGELDGPDAAFLWQSVIMEGFILLFWRG